MSDRTERVNELFAAWHARKIGRRQFIQGATALGVSSLAIQSALRQRSVGAQEATPSPGAAIEVPGTTPGSRSLTLAEHNQRLRQHFPYEEPANTGGQVIYASSSDLQTLQGLLIADSVSNLIGGRIFESLIAGNPIDGLPAPGLLEYWELAEDGVTYTFHLPQNAKWHDGTPITAEDVLFSYDMTLNEAVNTSYRSSVLDSTESYRVIDDYTFEIKSKGRLVTFLFDSPGSVVIIPKHIWESVPPENWANDPGATGEDPSRVVGSGPFKFKEWVIGDHATVVRNPDYYDPMNIPVIDEFIVRVVPDTAAEIQALRAGEADIIGTIAFSQVEDVANTEGLEVAVFPTTTFWYYMYNLDPEKTTLFQDKRVRQALFWAIDRQAIVDNITFGYAEVARGTQPRVSVGYAPDEIETNYTYDPERARQLLEEAGWVDSDGDGVREKDGQKFEVEWLSVAGIAEYEQMLAAIQQWWADIGVAMTPTFIDFPTLLDRMDAYDFQIMNLAFSWNIYGDQGPMFRCDAYEGGFNRMKYCNPEWDQLDDMQKVELDPERRRQILIQQANIINEDLPVGILVFRDNRMGYNARLKNFFPNGLFSGSELWSTPWLWLEQ